MKDRRITDGAGLLRELRRRGHSATPTADGHYQVFGPAGIAVISLKWSDPRDRHNTLAELRRHAGIDLAETPQAPPRPGTGCASAPPKLHLPGPRPQLQYTKTTSNPEKAPVTTRNGTPYSSPAPTPAPSEHDPVRRDEHDALLGMLAEQGETLARLTDRLEQTEQLLREVTRQVMELTDAGRAGPAPQVEASYVTAMRRQVREFLATLPPSVQVPRSTIAEGIGDDSDLRQLSHVLRVMHADGELERTGVKSTSRWRLAPGSTS